MPTFPDLADSFDPNLVLPIRGVGYVVEPPSVTEVIKLRLVFADPERSATALERLEWQVRMLGARLDVESEQVIAEPDSLWAQMEADGVSGEEMLLAGNAALLRFGINPDLAAVFWSPETLGGAIEVGDGQGKGPASNRKARKATPRKKTPRKAT